MGLLPFLDALRRGPLVFDGAMGTQLYERGGAPNRSFDELSSSQPALVAQVHRDYLDVGVDVIQTNSYGANRFALATHGFEDRVEAICKDAARVARDVVKDSAYVGGAIGPSGLLAKDLIRNKTRRLAFDAFREQSQALAQGGCDLLVFETFSYVGELELAVEAAYGVNIPIVAQATFNEQGLTDDGATPEETVERLLALGVDVVGANCKLGPEPLLDIVARMTGKGLPVIMQPNVGYPRVVDGRTLFSSPETYGVVARRAFKLGVTAVGGCCGTGPEHVRRVVAAARMLGGGKRFSTPSGDAVDVRPAGSVPAEPRGEAPVPFVERSRFAHKLARGDFVVSVEVPSPQGLDPSKTLERIQMLEKGGVDVVNIPDGPRATVRMANQAMARLVLDRCPTIEPILHVCGRDRNLLALQADLIGAHVQGIRNTVIITGDPPKVGDYKDATAVFDLDSIGILNLARGLNRGLDPAGKPFGTGQKTAFVLATGAEPAALDFDREMQRLRDKKEAGAELVMTQPVFDPATLDRFLDAIADLDLPVLVGILPLASAKNALFLHTQVPGMRLPPDVLARMQKAGDGKDAAREGVAIAAEALRVLKGRVRGAYIMPPFGRVELALEVLEKM